jgi:hypothetical protein
MQAINNTQLSIEKVRKNLVSAITICPTWLQTCWFKLDGSAPSRQDEDDYIGFISGLLHDNIRPQGVLLYSLARPSLQVEAPRLAPVTDQQMETFAERIRAVGVAVKVSA